MGLSLETSSLSGHFESPSILSSFSLGLPFASLSSPLAYFSDSVAPSKDVSSYYNESDFDEPPNCKPYVVD